IRVDEAAFEQGILRALAVLGLGAEEPAVDALADPIGGASALQGLGEEGTLLLRVAPELGAGTKAHAPSPREPLWALVRARSAELSLAALSGGGADPVARARAAPRGADAAVARARAAPGGADAAVTRRVERLVVNIDSVRCCDSPACSLEKRRASVWLQLD